MADYTGQMTLPNFLEESIEFFFFAFRSKFHPAVRQIAHGAAHLEPLGEALDRGAESNALNASFEVGDTSFHVKKEST